MNIAENLFKAYDIRGLVGAELTVELAEAVGRALADFLPIKGPVCVGYDMRPDSAELAAAVRTGLARQGRTVYDIGQVASDMIYFAVGRLAAAGGAMVTASHNPGAYNGIKLCAAEARPIGIETGLAVIRDAIAADDYKAAPTTPGQIEPRDIMEAWVNHALSFAGAMPLRPYHIAVDAGNGMGGLVVPHLAKKWPLIVEPMYFELDGTFPNHPANPLEPANNADLIAKVKADSLDFGVAFDGDGDRAFLIDETGQIVSGSVTTAILAEHFLRLNPGATILYNANCSRIVPETIEAHGGKAIRTKVGHSYIKADMRTYDAVFAGEHSGHYYFRDNWCADSGLIAVICAIAALSQSGQGLSALANQYRKYAASGELNFTVPDKAAAIARLKAAYADGQADELDGLTVNYPDWWFIVRPSNTEPLLRLNVEATTPALLEEHLHPLVELLQGLDPAHRSA
ncbi:MAG TPA: phosphomannomutase/phosphoglucomutase [Candidatus Saccharimonadia bacterium]|nr:phosphomannomutase/phosphoglucomutase [Candidatus Saccharimonadia bacterium]